MNRLRQALRRPRARLRRVLVALPLSAACLFAGSLLTTPFTGPASALAACSNEAIRAEQGQAALALPDCRAYELVSPLGAIFWLHENLTRVASSGNAITYGSYYPYPAAENEGRNFLSTRGPGGWSTESVLPPQNGARVSANFACAPSIFFSADLSQAVLASGWRDPRDSRYCLGDEPALVSGEPRGFANLFRRDTATGAYQLVNLTPEGAAPSNAYMSGGSADLSHVVFRSTSQLTPEAPSGGENAFEWSGGAVRLLTWSPAGAPVRGQLATLATAENPVSADGEEAFFDAEGGLYLRERPMQPQTPVNGAGECTDPALACTVQIDSPQAGAVGAPGGGVFQYATADGSRAFFTDESRLTADSTAASGKPDLYEWRAQGTAACAQAAGCLTDLTTDASEPAGVLKVMGISEDGSYVYLAAEGVLTNTPNARGESASPGGCGGEGGCKLYLRHGSTTTFIASLTAADLSEGGRVSPDGRFLGLSSTRRLTGFDNTPAQPEECGAEGCRELFLYEAEANRLACASCGTGAPVGPTSLPRGRETLPGQETTPFLLTPDEAAHYPPPRSVLDDGAFFFATPDPLAAGDVNGSVPDVYEYEGGAAHLISSGSSGIESEFMGASAGGSDVFFNTEQQLVRGDTDNNGSVYDARVGGGFPEPPPPPPCESEEACHGGGSGAPPVSSSATSHFEGSGNRHEQACRKGLVRRHGRCVRPHRGHHRVKHHHHHHRANANRKAHR